MSREKASYWIEKNRLNIIPSDAEYKIHIKSIDAFLKEDYEASRRLGYRANQMYQSHRKLRLK